MISRLKAWWNSLDEYEKMMWSFMFSYGFFGLVLFPVVMIISLFLTM